MTSEDRWNKLWRMIKEDGSVYHMSRLGHWSEVIHPQTGKTYYVKWIGGTGPHGGEYYISLEGVAFDKLPR